MLSHSKRLFLMVFLGAILLFTAQKAEAGGVVIYNYGEDAFETGPLPDSIKDTLPPGAKAGYKCQVFGLFWAYIATWKCTPVAFEETAGGFNFNDDADVAKAISDMYPPNTMKMGFWAGYGRWFLLLGLIALIALRFIAKKQGDNQTT